VKIYRCTECGLLYLHEINPTERRHCTIALCSGVLKPVLLPAANYEEEHDARCPAKHGGPCLCSQ
jgi:hypothetical protein